MYSMRVGLNSLWRSDHSNVSSQSRGLIQGLASVFNGVSSLPVLLVTAPLNFLLQFGLGFGGPFGGLITDWYVRTYATSWPYYPH